MISIRHISNSVSTISESLKACDANISSAGIKTEKPKRRFSSTSLSNSSCCGQEHLVMLSGQEVHYLVRSDKIFLLRWDITTALGGGQAIDFRKADRLLKVRLAFYEVKY